MKVMINSVHFKADQKLEDFVTEKVEKLCAKYSEVISAEVTLKLDNTDTPENKIADIRLVLRGDDLYASKQSKSFEESIDACIDALKKQLEKYKGKNAKWTLVGWLLQPHWKQKASLKYEAGFFLRQK